jgi:2-polyprenyl-3-methyl-5-hydroxy-6-metoxy-1,4-benzoquinol methylase
MWKITDPEKNSYDPVTRKLIEKLDPESTVFEYWCWRWRNILPLLDNWHTIYAQDVWGTALDDIKKRIKERENQAYLFKGNAEEHTHSVQYDAMMCLRMLHFLEIRDAMIVIWNMMKYTKPGWYNVHSLYLSQTKHNSQFFFPEVDKFINLYSSQGWVIKVQSEICKFNSSENDRIFYQKSVLFRKPQNSTQNAREDNQEDVNRIMSWSK